MEDRGARGARCCRARRMLVSGSGSPAEARTAPRSSAPSPPGPSPAGPRPARCTTRSRATAAVQPAAARPPYNPPAPVALPGRIRTARGTGRRKRRPPQTPASQGNLRPPYTPPAAGTQGRGIRLSSHRAAYPSRPPQPATGRPNRAAFAATERACGRSAAARGRRLPCHRRARRLRALRDDAARADCRRRAAVRLGDDRLRQRRPRPAARRRAPGAGQQLCVDAGLRPQGPDPQRGRGSELRPPHRGRSSTRFRPTSSMQPSRPRTRASTSIPGSTRSALRGRCTMPCASAT